LPVKPRKLRRDEVKILLEHLERIEKELEEIKSLIGYG